MANCEHCGAEVPDDSESCPSCGETLAAPDELLGTQILGRYTLVKLIAEGGMGRVYLAEQAVGSVQRRVAVKVLRKQLGRDKGLMTRFAREAETLVRLTHPNTVQLFDFGALPDGTLALAMEYVQGHSLARELHGKGPLAVSRAERMLTQICGALQEAHAHGIVHRDLKPDNLLIADRVGQGDFVKVLDFGIAKVSAEEDRKATKLTQQGMIIGTPPYMSPEQFSGEALDARSDVYSLGVIAYEMLSGKLPFTANTPWEWASRHLTGTPDTLRPDVARGLSSAHARAIESALQKKPEDRPQTVEAFLALFTEREGASAPTLSFSQPDALPTSSERPRAIGSGSFRPGDPQPDLQPTNTSRTGSLMRSQRPPSLAGFALGGIAVVAAALVLWLVLRRSPSEDTSQPTSQPASLPAPPAAVVTAPEPAQPASALPLGVAPPEQAKHESAREERKHRREREPAVSAPPAAVAKAEAPAAPAAVQPAEKPTPVVAQERPAATPTPARVTTPPDLESRIAGIQTAVTSRPEVALGMYQAAAGRYGAHPALSALRQQLAKAGENRVRQLLASGLCAQAQAVQRALRGAVGGTATPGLFGASCPAP